MTSPAPGPAVAAGDVFDPVVARGEHVAPAVARALSKKEEWLRDKDLRPDVHTSDADLRRALVVKGKAPAARAKRAAATGAEPVRVAGQRIEPLTTLFNVWTREALPILPGQTQATLASR